MSIDRSANVPVVPSTLSPSDDGGRFLKAREGFAAGVYADVADKDTVGYGHRIRPGESFPDGVTREQAERLFESDVATAAAAVRRLVTTHLTQAQFDALVSLVYNVGEGAFVRSALLRKLNAGDCEGAASEFLDWHKVRGPDGRLRPVAGLADRRRRERVLFLTGSYGETADA